MSDNEAHVICFCNHKGGVGKTCSTCNVGAGLARAGKRVLLVDFDPQSNLSISLGIKDEDAVERSVYRLLAGEIKLAGATIHLRENLDLVPADLDLAAAEVTMAAEPGREILLREIIEPARARYDYILIDCSPQLGLLTTNALTAATEVYIPLQPQFLSLQGVRLLSNVIDKIKRRLNKRLNIGGVFITQFDQRKVLNRDVAEMVETYYKQSLFKTRIRDNVALAEAPGKGQDIFKYSPRSYGAQDYSSLCSEILSRHIGQANSEGGDQCHASERI